MIHIQSWHDMHRFGISYLTGEADAVGKRVLFDVNEKGRGLLCEILGLPRDTKFCENWNSSVEGAKAVGSILLPPSLLHFLAAMCCLATGCKVAVVTKTSGVFGLTEEDDMAAVVDLPVNEAVTDAATGETAWVTVTKPVNDPLGKLRKYYGIEETYGTLNVPRVGLSAVHQMSGRAQGA